MNRLSVKRPTAELILERRGRNVLLTLLEEHRRGSSSEARALARHPVQLQRAMCGLPVHLPLHETRRQLVADLSTVQAISPFALTRGEMEQVQAFLTGQP